MKFNHEDGQSIEIDGASIYYEIVGKQDALPLLLLHGGIGTIEDFNSLVPSLGAQFRVIGIDSRGHGRSTLGEAKLTYQRLEQDVVGILQHLGIEKTSVLGFSDGGIVGYRLMASETVAVPKLITIGASCELKDDDSVREIYARITGESWRAKFPASYELYQRLNPEADFDHFVAETVGMWLDSSPSGYPAGRVDGLNGEILIMRGDDDHLFSRQDAVDQAKRIKLSSLENIAFARHAAHEDRPDAVVNSIKFFLEKATSLDLQEAT